jgi:hypothetical protein
MGFLLHGETFTLMEKKLTNSDPLRESARKHSIYPFDHKSPDLLSEQELQHYFLYRENVDGLAPASMRICYSGIRFFSQHVLKRDWHTLSLLRAQTTHRTHTGHEEADERLNTLMHGLLP